MKILPRKDNGKVNWFKVNKLFKQLMFPLNLFCVAIIITVFIVKVEQGKQQRQEKRQQYLELCIKAGGLHLDEDYDCWGSKVEKYWEEPCSKNSH